MYETMGQKISAKRQEINMTLAELGAKVGVSASTVRKWEVGFIKEVGSDKVKKIASALDVEPAYLMGWTNDNRVSVENVNANNGIIGHANAPVTINGGETLSQDEKELLRIYRSLGFNRRVKLLSAAIDLETEEAGQ